MCAGYAQDPETIFYCHGFGSCFDTTSDKVSILSQLAPVAGTTVDYTQMPERVFSEFSCSIQALNISLIVGTSMGGFFASWLASSFGLPFVAINPAIDPSRSLRKHIGDGLTYFGNPYTLSAAVVDAYAGLPFRTDGKGLVAVDLADEVIDSEETLTLVKGKLPTAVFGGGSHRFDHMTELLPRLRDFQTNFW